MSTLQRCSHVERLRIRSEKSPGGGTQLDADAAVAGQGRDIVTARERLGKAAQGLGDLAVVGAVEMDRMAVGVGRLEAFGLKAIDHVVHYRSPEPCRLQGRRAHPAEMVKID